MSQNAWKVIKSDYFKLVPILALAFYVAFIPHLNYPYAVHIDEWVHISHSNALLRAADIFYPDPFPGQESGAKAALLELGYHLPLAVFNQISGISWMDIARYLPSVVFVFTVLSVYIFAKRMGFGWEAAFFATLTPSTVGILGPAFLVPVAMGLMFVPLLLYLVFNHKTFWSYLVICASISFLVVLHAPSAFLVVLLLIPFVILGFKGDLKHSLWIILAIAFPFFITLPWTFSLILAELRSLFTQQPMPAYHDVLSIISGYGYLPVATCLLGTLVLAMKGTQRNYSLVTGLLVLLVMLTGFSVYHYGIGIVYFRGLLFSMLMMSIIAGAGLSALWKLEIPWITGLRLRKPRIVHAAGILLCLAVIGVTLASAIPDRQNIPYYHMIDKTDYEAFAWIKDNVDLNRQKAILDPWKATPFAALTKKYVYTRIHQAPKDTDERAYAFLRSGSTNTTFLIENGISIIYTRVYEWGQGTTIEYDVNNPDLVEVRKDIYLLKERVTK